MREGGRICRTLRYMKNPPFDLLVWGSLRLAPINFAPFLHLVPFFQPCFMVLIHGSTNYSIICETYILALFYFKRAFENNLYTSGSTAGLLIFVKLVF